MSELIGLINENHYNCLLLSLLILLYCENTVWASTGNNNKTLVQVWEALEAPKHDLSHFSPFTNRSFLIPFFSLCLTLNLSFGESQYPILDTPIQSPLFITIYTIAS